MPPAYLSSRTATPQPSDAFSNAKSSSPSTTAGMNSTATTNTIASTPASSRTTNNRDAAAAAAAESVGEAFALHARVLALEQFLVQKKSARNRYHKLLVPFFFFAFSYYPISFPFSFASVFWYVLCS
jgi:hypothetical protein